MACTDSAHLSKPAADVFGLSVTNALALTTRSSSCWIARLRVEAISVEARWNDSRVWLVSERATARAPSTEASTPISTSRAVIAAQTLVRPRAGGSGRARAAMREPDGDAASGRELAFE